MTGPRSDRLISWLDSLDQEERQVAEYAIGMEGGTQADAHLAIMLWRVDARLTAIEKRSVVKDGAKLLGALGSGIVLAISALFAKVTA